MNRFHESDEDLMAEVARGRREAMEPLVRRYGSPLLTFIRRLVGDAHRSEELFQEVFLAVWVKRGLYDYARPFRPWLYKIALNQCRASLRRRSPACLIDPEPVLLGLADARAASPVEAAEHAEAAALVERAMDLLTEKQRAVLALRLWNGLSYAEIAEVMDKRQVTVRSYMHHALKAMRRELEAPLRGPRPAGR